jgi:hypothetical protein
MASASQVGDSAGGGRSKRTTRGAFANGSNNEEGGGGSSSTTPASSRGHGGGGGGSRRPPAPTVLVETSNAPLPDLPAGWTMKTFQRANSKRGEKSTDKYFYSPSKKIKFRSLKACREFTVILKELRAHNRWKYGLWDPPGGSESAALEEFKARGHRM